MRKLKPDELLRVMRHVVEDLLALHDPTVTHTCWELPRRPCCTRSCRAPAGSPWGWWD
jgi:hypothetical protein